MRMLPPNDALFLTMESRSKPFHVAGMQLFSLPDGAGEDYMLDFHRSSLQVDKLKRIYRERLESSMGRYGWVEDEDLDLEYHVRLSALPRPGRVRELLTLVSRLHGTLLDRNRPLWETHLIEGLQGNRFAVYGKIHHAVVDGVAGTRLVQESLSEDPNELDMLPPWAQRPDEKQRPPREKQSILGAISSMAEGLGKQAATVPGIAKGMYDLYRATATRSEAVAPYQAPKTMLNVPITGARRFAAQSWPLERVKAVGKASGGTLNDAVLAMCAGALRRYLEGMHALPDEPLISMVPVSVRPKGDDEYGNAITAILCNLGTDIDDPAKRMRVIHDSMQVGKELLANMSRDEIINMGVLNAVPLLVGQMLGLDGRTRPAFNITISNVPGPKKPLYWNGARMQAMYPVSIVMDGQALNITVTSYAGSLEFGLTGCRRSVPHLQRLLADLEDALGELEEAVGIPRGGG